MAAPRSPAARTAFFLALAAGENHGGDGETFGQFVEEHGEENEQTPSQVETRKPAPIATPSKNVWIARPSSTVARACWWLISSVCVSSPK